MGLETALASARVAALLGQGESLQDVRRRFQDSGGLAVDGCLKHGQDLLRRAPGLFRGRAGQVTLRIFDAIDRLPWRRRHVAIAALFIGPILIAFFVLQPLIEHYHDAEWTRAVAPESAVAQGLSDRLLLLQQDIGEMPATPAGISRHADAALQSVRSAEHDLDALKVWGGPGSSVHDTYWSLGELSGSQLRAALVHDRPLLTDAQYQVARADSELALARELASTSNAWDGVSNNIPADLPADLVPAWGHAADRLQAGLESGNVNAANAAVATLKMLQEAGSLDRTIASDQRALSGPAVSAGASIVARIRGDIASGDAAGANAGIAMLNAVVGRVRSSYVLHIANHAGMDTGIVRRDRLTGQTACYVIVEAFSPQGAPISIPVFDNELTKWVVTHAYGVQVSLAQYRTFMDDKATGTLPVMAGTKPPGVLNATYAFPVMSDRITAF